MEQNLAKEVWRLVRVLYFMLRRNISKSRLLHDLNRMMKRRKIAGKSLHDRLTFHHRNNWPAFPTNFSPPPGEYEFSCSDSNSNSPSTNYRPFSLFSSRHKHHSNYQHPEDLDIMAVNAAVQKAMEMIHSETASPALPGFGRSPMVRQLRVTDSPFPLSSVDEDSHVDKEAEEFISRFYNDLRRQNTAGNQSSG